MVEDLQLLLCSPLWFLIGKFGNTAAKTLKKWFIVYIIMMIKGKN